MSEDDQFVVAMTLSCTALAVSITVLALKTFA